MSSSKQPEGTTLRDLLCRAACLLLLASPLPAGAQASQNPQNGKDAPTSAVARPLAPDAVSQQRLDLPGRTLRFTATAAFVRLLDDKGSPEADIATTAYTLDGADPASRPVTFVLNGGPGMASAWLEMGAVGPWRIPMQPGPSASATPDPNADTWLDFTDLVFIDPAGTGYSDFVGPGEEARKRLWSLDGDIASLSQTIHRWLSKSGRIASPKFLLGESYGAFRAPLLARHLAEHDGVGLRGLVMLSPVLDFGNHSRAFDLLGYANVLPSMAATVRAADGKTVSRADLQDAEAYASGPFLSDALRGVADSEAVGRVIEQVAALTGLDPGLVRQHRGLITGQLFAHEHDRPTGRVDSLYDATVALPDPFPETPQKHAADPLLDGLRAPLTEAMLAVYQMLKWHPEGPIYRLLNEAANREWDYGQDLRPESFDALREALALDPGLHVLIAHGLFDLVTPYYATQLLLNQIPAASGRDRVRLLTFPGGHMLYSRDQSRRDLRARAAELMEARP
jgi:carboxypeptidase C (cathepsin A)